MTYVSQRSNVLIFAIVGSLLLYGIDLSTRPSKGEDVPLPFGNGECLTYKHTAPSSSEPALSDVCFETLPNGSFIERASGLRFTYSKDGRSATSDTDIAANARAPIPFKLDPISEDIAKKMRWHNRYYADPRLSVGDLSLFNYPVKEFAEFNGKAVYVVEIDPWIDTNLAVRGIIGKPLIKLSYYDRLVYKYSRTKKSAGTSIVERLYYDRKTGILEGSEKFNLTRDQNGKIISKSEPERNELIGSAVKP